MRIEDLYIELRKAGGEVAQRDRGVLADEVVAAFAGTVAEMDDLGGSGAFYPDRKTTLRDLADDTNRLSRGELPDTAALQAKLGLPRWPVAGAPGLDFYYVDREIVVARGEVDGRGKNYGPDIRLDCLLVNATPGDRTPIAAELKLRSDMNGLLALVQGLAAAAQLSPAWQRKRLVANYPEYFGTEVPSRLDVYVVMHEPRETGVKAELMSLALAMAADLQAESRLGTWLRRIAFLKTVTDPRLAFELIDTPVEFAEI